MVAPVTGSQRSARGGGWGATGREGLQGFWALWPTVGGERGQQLLETTSEARPHPAGSLSTPSLGHRLPLGSRNTHNLPKLQGQAAGLREAVPVKGPQTNCFKNRLGVAKEVLGRTSGGGQRTCHGRGVHPTPLPFPRWGPETSRRPQDVPKASNVSPRATETPRGCSCPQGRGHGRPVCAPGVLQDPWVQLKLLAQSTVLSS